MLSITTIQTFHENLEQLSNELKERLIESEHPAVDKKVEMSILGLEHLLFNHPFTPIQEKTLMKIDSIIQLAAITREAYAYYEKDMERTHAQEMLTMNTTEVTLTQPLLRRKYSLLNREAHLAHVKPMERAVVLGSGAFPITSITLARRFGAFVSVYETNEVNQQIGNEVIQKIGLHPKVRFIQQKEIAAHLQKADAVWLGMRLEEKRKCLEEIAPILSPGTRIVCRTVYGLRTLIHEHVSTKGLTHYTKIGTIHPRKMELESSELFIR
ncbi:MAG: nicotianamine synthase family protein [Candidatus Diapherotrites archaeon]